ncbi:MAG: bifunctional phosphopantothenoylcysteine decarboxylase/phosphopantothenate--cysteine ligase CoaBC [Armatimonadota bacterium]
MSALGGRTVVLGVCGGIAAYKSADLCSRLVQAGASVRVVMTENACRFVTPLTFQTLSQAPVAMDMFAPPQNWEIEHISLAEAADAVVVAPATANTIAKMAAGIADDLLTTTILAVRAPILVAPAMNPRMYLHPATQENIQRLRSRGIIVMEPAEGRMACGDVGPGRLPDVQSIVDELERLLSRGRDLAGFRLLVTAGPTRQWLDPVRFISNPSTGKMGYAVAEAALARGAEVVLITGPTHLTPPAGAQVRRVETTDELFRAAAAAFPECDAAVCAAAPADHAPEQIAEQKIKRAESGRIRITLVPTQDVAAELGRMKGDRVLVTFAAETEDLIANAKRKMFAKNADLTVANDVTAPQAGFAVDTNKVTIITADGNVEPLPLMPKRELAHHILDRVVGLLHQRRPHSRPLGAVT